MFRQLLIISFIFISCVPTLYAQPAELWQTGQTSSFHDGDDGALRRGVAWPSSRFTDNNDGTITDNLTGLMWLKDASCLGTKAWMEAIDAIAELNTTPGSFDCREYTANYTDWRLSNRKEIRSLVNYGVGEVNIWLKSRGFWDVQNNRYWSSTTYAIDTDSAWTVSMGEGSTETGSKSNGNYLWPVRAGRGEFTGSPEIVVSPASNNFGHVNVGETSNPEVFTISNAGNKDLVIGSISITGTDSADFSLQSDNCSGRTISPSGSCEIQAVFSPSAKGVRASFISIPSNDPHPPILEVLLQGTGSPLENPSILWQTGQAAIYRDNDDGDVRRGVVWPDQRFTDNRDGTIRDNLTGLLWLKDAGCFRTKPWKEAIDTIEELNTIPGSLDCREYTAEYPNWRLPNRKEIR
ncbi:MAG: Lcl domain-containing protein, partial [Candidatus Anammoxibacter sp.]